MAWPNTPFRTMSDGTTFWDAALGNALQSAINVVYNALGLQSSYPPSTGDAPQVSLQNSASNLRAVLCDHNGLFTMGRINHFREEWKASFSTSSGGAISADPAWFLTVAGSPGSTLTQAPPSFYGGNVVNLGVLNTTNNKIALATSMQVANPSNTAASWVLEYDLAPDAIGSNGFTYWHGFSGSKDPNSPASGYAWFRKSNGDTNWQCETNDGATTTTVGTSVAPTTDSTALQRFRIEIHGSATPYGAATVRFFINETLVATSTTHLPTAAQYVTFAGLCTAGPGTGHELMVGTVSLSSNRFSTTGAL